MPSKPRKQIGQCYYCGTPIWSTDKWSVIAGALFCSAEMITKMALETENDVINRMKAYR